MIRPYNTAAPQTGFRTCNGPPSSALVIDSFGESVVVGYNSGLINLFELSDTVDVTKIIPTRTIRYGVTGQYNL